MPRRIRKAAVGLGNPGAQYARTRHNLGFLAIDRFLELQAEKPLKLESSTVLLYRVDDVLVAKPMTYMNRSGLAVRELVARFRLAPSQILIVYDDHALPLGTMRARARGSSGGHHGMESIIAALGTEGIPRLRLGIATETSSALEDLTEYVLGQFTPEEEEKLAPLLTRAAEAIDCFFQQDIAAVMNRFNR